MGLWLAAKTPILSWLKSTFADVVADVSFVHSFKDSTRYCNNPTCFSNGVFADLFADVECHKAKAKTRFSANHSPTIKQEATAEKLSREVSASWHSADWQLQ